jgi:hypothetical protein
LAGDRE